MKDEAIHMMGLRRPMGMPREALRQLAKTNPAAQAMNVLAQGVAPLDEKRRIVRQMQMNALNHNPRIGK
ncbi:hypothetical protein [Paraburkholderia adhaesiva]|uniref:hypothetical protein n=1 Tax=Paraburkholderia adhaesiva TaxID=2883244 RepID=UPI001F1BDF8E|nr:hypothetical protein [Paraburkholderia adhaesiva]